MAPLTDAQLRAASMEAANRFGFLWAWIIAQEKSIADITTKTNLACQATKIDPPLFTMTYLRNNAAELRGMKARLNQWIQQHANVLRPNSAVTITDTGVVQFEQRLFPSEIDISPEELKLILARRAMRRANENGGGTSLQIPTDDSSQTSASVTDGTGNGKEATTTSSTQDTSDSEDEEAEALDRFTARMNLYGMEPTSPTEKGLGPKTKSLPSREWWE